MTLHPLCVIVGSCFALFGLVMFVHLLFETYHMHRYHAECRKTEVEPSWQRWATESDGRIFYRKVVQGDSATDFRVVGCIFSPHDAHRVVELLNRCRFIVRDNE